MAFFNGDPAADIYVSSAGNDANSGLSPSAPKLTIAAALALAALYAIPVNLHLRSGDTFRGAANRLTGSIAGMTVDTYGGTNKAQVDGGINIVGNTFTSIGSNRYTTTYTSSSDNTIPVLLSYSGATRTRKAASQSAVNAPGTWFASAAGNVVTVTVYSIGAPTLAYSSIMLDWQTCIFVTAARVTINNVRAANGYAGWFYIGAVNAKGFAQEASRNASDGFLWTTGSHGCVHWSPIAQENGIGPEQGNHGFHIGSGSSVSIDVWGGQLWHPVAINNGEDGIAGGVTPGGAWRIFNAVCAANYENAADIKGGNFEFYGGIFDQRGSFATSSPVTLHINAPNAKFYDMKIYGRDQGALSTQHGIVFDQGSTGTIVRCEIWCWAGSGILCQPTSGAISVIASSVWKQAIGSITAAVRFQNDATHPATHSLKHVTVSGNITGGVPLSMICLQADGAGVSGSSINCIWNNPTTVASNRECLTANGALVWTSTNDIYWKGEPNDVARGSSAKTAAQVAAGFTSGALTVSAAIVTNPSLYDITTGNLRPAADGSAKNTASPAAAVFADRDNIAFDGSLDVGALKCAA